MAYLVGEESSNIPRCSTWCFASLWKFSHSFQETIHVKCELDGGMDPIDLAICNHLKFHLQDGATAQRFPSVSRQLQHQRKGQVN